MHETRPRRNRDASNTAATRSAARYRAGIATRAAQALFVLLPARASVDDLLSSLPEPVRAQLPGLVFRRYPRADDSRHLRSLVRAGRDALATRWLRGTVLAIAAGAGLGALVNGILAAGFHMLGGMLEIAIPLGLGIGAFLGGFTAAMTGTEVPRDELQALWPHVGAGDSLLQWSGDDRNTLAALRAHAERASLATATVTR